MSTSCALGKDSTVRVARAAARRWAPTASPGIKRGGTVNIVAHTLDADQPGREHSEVRSRSTCPGSRSATRSHLGEIKLPDGVEDGDPARRDAGHHRAAVGLRRRARRLLRAAHGCRCCDRCRRRLPAGAPRAVLRAAAPAAQAPASGGAVPRRRLAAPAEEVGGAADGSHAPFRRARQSRRASTPGHRHNIGFMAVDAIVRRHGFAPWRRRFQGVTAEGTLGGERVVLLLARHLYERVRTRGRPRRRTSSSSPRRQRGGVPRRDRAAAVQAAREGRRRQCRP